ncbi:MAG: RHS repeat-associated core domain-containing protein [Chitinophagaceae bacterium]|nr:MAG: RHS repeat-associated core domain-containing protein [Chitinophagaceae bacterium]
MGNIVSKTDAGNYTYNSSKVNAVAYITNPAGGMLPPAVLPVTQQDITYTAFQKTQLVTDNNYETAYTYGADYERIKSVLKLNGTTIETKYYLGGMERQNKNGSTRDIHYIGAGNGLCAILVKQNSATEIYYTYKDYLGSILTVTNNVGTVVVDQNFDAWGRKRNITDGSYNNIASNPDWLYRGYTGHEHLNEQGLINMNGRMYDPVQGRMMSPDALINDAFSTQSFNMYSYVLNNPLKFNDPSGYTYQNGSGDDKDNANEVWDVIHQLWNSDYGGSWSHGGNPKEFESDAEAISFGWTSGGFGNGGTTWEDVKSNYYNFGGQDESFQNYYEPIVVYGNIVDGQWNTSWVDYGYESPATTEDNSSSSGIVSWVQTGLDILGSTEIPIISQIGDIGSGLVSVVQGDWTGAGMSFAGTIIPGFSQIKMARKTLQLTAKARTAERGLEIGERFLRKGYDEIAPGVFRSSDGFRQFRMTDSDILGKHGKIGPHFNFEVLDAQGNFLKNYHMPIK